MQKIAGLLFFFGGSVVILGIMTAEIFYPPGYNVSLNMISSLAATPPPDSIVREPSASIFDYTMILSGIFIVCGAFFLHLSQNNKVLVISVAIMGISASAVGVFPAYHAVIHPLVACVTFLAGGIAAVFSARVASLPFRYLALFFGIASLSFLAGGVFMPESVVPIFGKGGTERLVAYPILLWLIGFGGYLMNTLASKGGRAK